MEHDLILRLLEPFFPANFSRLSEAVWEEEAERGTTAGGSFPAEGGSAGGNWYSRGGGMMGSGDEVESSSPVCGGFVS